MPAMVGGYGNLGNEIISIMSIMFKIPKLFLLNIKNNQELLKSSVKNRSLTFNSNQNGKKILGAYLAGLIEGDGTIAVHDFNSMAKKYTPKIIIVFKKADLPLAEYLQKLTNCVRIERKIYLKPGRGYVLWQIQDIVGVFTMITLINGYMRTPKIEAFLEP